MNDVLTVVIQSLRKFIGAYQPIMQQVHYVTIDGQDAFYEIPAQGIASINVEYVCGFILFLFIMYTLYGYMSSTAQYLLGTVNNGFKKRRY